MKTYKILFLDDAFQQQDANSKELENLTKKIGKKLNEKLPTDHFLSQEKKITKIRIQTSYKLFSLEQENIKKLSNLYIDKDIERDIEKENLNSFHMLFMDIFKEGDCIGVEIVKKVREKIFKEAQVHIVKKLPVVYMSSLVNDEQTQNSFIRDHVFEKSIIPTDPNRFVETVFQEIKIAELLKESSIDDIQDEMITCDIAMLKMKKLILNQVAYEDSNVLILGETGVGKEHIPRLIAKKRKEIFKFSPQEKDLAIFSMAGMADDGNLCYSEIFGHVKGAFTGAVRSKESIFEEAKKGILFLDEIGDAPPRIQRYLLRAVQFKEIRKLGSNETNTFQCRLVMATCKNLVEMVMCNDFREDLYFRIRERVLWIPPLRKRKSDIPILAEYFRQKWIQKTKKLCKLIDKKFEEKEIPEIPFRCINQMKEYSWPGNIRELENTINNMLNNSYSYTNDTQSDEKDLSRAFYFCGDTDELRIHQKNTNTDFANIIDCINAAVIILQQQNNTNKNDTSRNFAAEFRKQLDKHMPSLEKFLAINSLPNKKDVRSNLLTLLRLTVNSFLLKTDKNINKINLNRFRIELEELADLGLIDSVEKLFTKKEKI